MKNFENEEELRQKLNDEYLKQKYEEFQEYYVKGNIMPSSVYNDMLEKSVGAVILQVIKLDPVLRAAMEITESQAVKALQNIKKILDDDSLKDPECFQRIEKIVGELEDIGTSTTRHDF